MFSSSGRASPGPRKMRLQTPTDDASDASMPSRPKSPFALPFRKRDNTSASGGGSALPASSSGSSVQPSPTSPVSPTQIPSRRGIFRKKSISSMSMMSINDDAGGDDNDGHPPRQQQQTPASPSPSSSSRIPTRNGSASPSPAARKANHRRSVSYSGIIESANRAQSEMQQHQTPPSPSQRSLHARSPSATSSRIPISASSDAAYTRNAQSSTPTSPRRLYGQDDVQNYIRSGRPGHGTDLSSDTSRSKTPTNARPLQSSPTSTTPPPSAIPRLSPSRPGHSRSPSLLERATRAASSGSITKFYDAVESSPVSDHGETEDLLSSSANTSANNSPRMGVKATPPHDGRSVSVLGIRAEDELASQSASPTSRIPRSAGMRSQLSRSGSTSSRRSFFEWVSGSTTGNGGSGNSGSNANDGAAGGDASSIKSSSTQTNHTMTPSSSSTSSNQGGGGLKFPPSPLNFLRSSSALGHYPERSTTPIPTYPQSSARPRDQSRSHARAPSQVSMYSPTNTASPSLQGTPTKGQNQQQSQSSGSGIPFYRRLRTTSTSAKSLLNGGSSADRDNVSSQKPAQSSPEQHIPPRAPSAMSGFFSSLQKTRSKDELQAPQPPSNSQSKLSALGGLRRNRADTSVPINKRPTKESISQPLERSGDQQPQQRSYLQARPSHEPFRSASAMSFRNDSLPSPSSAFSRLPFDNGPDEVVHSRRGSAATTTAPTSGTATPFHSAHSHRSKSPSLSITRRPEHTVDSSPASALRGRGLRKDHGGSSSNNSSRHSLFLPSTGNSGGAGHLVASNLKMAGKRGWGMVKGWRGQGGAATEDEDAVGANTSNKARKNNEDPQQQHVYGIGRTSSVHGGGQDAVLRKWASLPEVIPAAILASSPDTQESLIFGVALRDAVIRTRLISPDVDDYLDAREKASLRRDSRNNSVSSQASQSESAPHAKRWHQSKRSVASKSDLTGAVAASRDEPPSHLRKTMPQVHPRKRPSRIGILDLGSDFSLSSELFGGEEREWDTSYDSFRSIGSSRSGVLDSDGDSGQGSRTLRVPVDRLKARRQYLPRFVTRCIESLETFGLTEEGVYRLSGRSSHTNRLRALFDGRLDMVVPGESDDDFGWDLDLKSLDPIECDLNSVCSALKAYLRELPTPVLDREHLKLVTGQAQKLERSKKAAGGALSEVDADLVMTLLTDMEPAPWYLLRELAWHLGDLTQETVVAKTKMTLSNLSLVLAPTLSIPVNALAFIVTQREVLFQRAPKEDTQLDKVREGDVIGGVVGRLGRSSGLASSGTSTPSSTASPSAFANSTFSFSMAPSPKLQHSSSGDSSEGPPRLRPRGTLNVDTSGEERSHYRDSSASDATILAASFMPRSPLTQSSSPRPDAASDGLFGRGQQQQDEEPREVLHAGAYDSRGVGVGAPRKPHAYSHSASNSGSTWGSANTDSTSDTYRSQMSSANSLNLTSDEEAVSQQQQRQLPPPPPISKDDGHWTRLREKSSGSERDGDSTLSAPSSPAAVGKRTSPSAYKSMSPSPSQGSFAQQQQARSGIPRSPSGVSYASSPRSPSSPSSSSLAHSQSYSSFASDEQQSGVARSGRTSALDRPRPVPSGSGSGSFFAGAGSSSGHGSGTIRRPRGASVSRS